MPDLKPNELGALHELKQRLKRDFNLVEMKLFGSKARGDSRPESDLDVLIVLEGCDAETEFAVYDLCYDVGADFGVFIAPVLFSRAESESRLTRATDFYQNVAVEGVVV